MKFEFFTATPQGNDAAGFVPIRWCPNSPGDALHAKLFRTRHCRGRLVVDPAHKHPEGALCAAGGFYPPLQLRRQSRRRVD